MKVTAKAIATTKALLTTQERTQVVIDAWRGLPGELMMLKGLMCIEHTLQSAYENKGARFTEALAAADIGLDRMMVAARMDELINSGGGN